MISYTNDILFIVVLYKTKIQECMSILSILESLKGEEPEFFVYDNSPDLNNYSFKGLNYTKVKYMADPENSGVSRAYNLGSEYAAAHGKKWLLLCDQDTIFDANYFDFLFKALHEHNPAITAPFLYSNGILISPCAFRLNYGNRLKTIPLPGRNAFNCKALLNSGLLIRQNVFKASGGYNEKVFLDFADFDFIKRLKKICPAFYLLDVKLEHHLESTRMQVFNRERFVAYCRSYRAAVHNLFDLFTITTIVLARTIKLSVRHRIVSPVGYCFNFFLLKH